MMMERFSLDTNVFDLIAADGRMIELVCRLVEKGEIQLVTTHIQRDELAKIPDVEKRKRIARIPTMLVPTYGFVLGVSRLDMGRLGESGPYEAMTGENRAKYARDALIATTAQGEGTILVAEDRRLRNRAQRELGVEAWDWVRFRSRLEQLSEEPPPDQSDLPPQ